MEDVAKNKTGQRGGGRLFLEVFGIVFAHCAQRAAHVSSWDLKGICASFNPCAFRTYLQTR